METVANQDKAIHKQETKTLNQVSDSHWQPVILRQINRVLNSAVAGEEIIPQVLSIVGEGFQVDSVIVLRVEPPIYQTYHTWSVNGHKLAEIIEGLACREWSQFPTLKEPYQIYHFCHSGDRLQDFLDISSIDKPTLESFFPCCILSLPLSINQQFFGYFILQTQQSHRSFILEEIKTLEIIVEQIAIAIHHIQLQERLNHLESQQNNGHNKSDYLSHMSHELRTPLTGILGFSKMLREELYGPLNDKQKQYINGISVSGEHLLALINDFLDLSKIEAEREEIFLETIAVEDLCLSAISMVEPKAYEQGLSLIVDIGDNIDFCTVDQRRIKQILLNLLSNAIKFTEKGSVTLQVKRNETKLTFCVIDTGIGLKEADQQKLFQPFQQIYSHLSRKHKGTGLGLALSRKLAQLHGGDLSLTSEEGKGSCFTLDLPIHPGTGHDLNS